MNHLPDTKKEFIENIKKLNLTIFSNQVGGHSCLLKPNKSADFLIKPFNEQEFTFYEQLSREQTPKLLSFVPKYYGIYSLEENQIPEIHDLDFSKKESENEDTTKFKRPKVKISGIKNCLQRDEKVFHKSCSTSSTLDHKELQLNHAYISKSDWFDKLYLERFKKNNTSTFFYFWQ